MRRIDVPEIGYTPMGLYDSVSARRVPSTRKILTSLRAKVERAYGGYEAVVSGIGVARPLRVAADEYRALTVNYDRLLEVERDAYDAILFAVEFGRCPMCGDREATTIDHYAPRSAFAEFSVHPVNLLPCCVQCNKAKSDDFESGGEALFVHHYLDKIDAFGQFLQAEVRWTDDAFDIRFWIEPEPRMPTALADRILSQFDELNLERHYRLEAVGELVGRSVTARASVKLGVSPSIVSAVLEAEAEQFAFVTGANSWKPVALKAMAASSDFCSGQRPPWAVD